MSYQVLPIEEIYSIKKLCADFFKLAEEPGEFNWRFFRNYWQEIYENNRGAIIIEHDGNEPVAMLGCIICAEMCTGHKTVEECFFYADKNKKTNGFKLLELFEFAAKDIGAKVIYIKHTAHLDSDRLEKIYNRKGFVKKFIRYEKVI